MTEARPRARIYIDGFNFYYAAFVEGSMARWKWLDLVAFSRCLVPNMDVDHVRYFTARVKPRPGHDSHIRQGIYLNALGTLTNLSVHLGSFSKQEVPMHLAPAPPNGARPGIVYKEDGGPERAWVYKLEEKGSDVNLATYLLRDAFKNLFDVAVVVSDDSDLLEPVKMVQNEFGREVIVARVPRSWKGKKGQRRGSVFEGKVKFVKEIRRSYLSDSQLPVTITTRDGSTIARPPEWGPPRESCL